MKRHFIMMLILSALGLSACSNELSVKRPDVIKFGTSRADIAAALASECTTIDEREFNPPEIPDVTSHSQIDCEGFEYFGAPRLAEFVFADDALILVWILVEEADLVSLEAAFKDKFGEPTYVAEDITAFADSNAAVRKDTPEALYYAEAVAPLVEARFKAE